MKRCTLALLALGMFAVAQAMPTEAELKKVGTLVQDLMRDDQAALKNGKKTRSEVAQAAQALSKEADSEAAKYLLLKGAFNLYARDGEIDKAIGTLRDLYEAIPDIPAEDAAAIVERSLRSAPRKSAGQLSRLLKDIKTRVRLEDEVKTLAASVKKDPNNRKLRTQLAEHYAQLGNWTKALEAFSKADARASACAKSELKGTALDKAADFWWNYPSGKDEELASCFRAHSAELYQKLLANGQLSGLAKVQAERRVKEAQADEPSFFASVAWSPSSAVGPDLVAEQYGSASTAPSPVKPLPAANSPQAARVPMAAAPSSSEELSIEIAPGRKMPFVKCPAGTFNMGNPNAGKRAKDPCDVKFFHEVTITRPFWMSKYPVTVGDYEAVMRQKLPLTDAQKAIGPAMPLIVLGGDVPHEFFRRVAQQAARQLPKGTVLRLPTEAELYYAWQAGKDFSLTTRYLSSSYYYSWKDIKELLASKGVPIPEPKDPSKKTPEDACFGPYGIPKTECVYGPVGQRQPTEWGLCDFQAISHTMVLDRVRKIGMGESKRSPRLAKDVDPLYVDGPDAMGVSVAFCFSGYHWFGTVHLVIGPDLIKEKGLVSQYKKQ